MQSVIRYILGVFLVVFLYSGDIFGQISEGGTPMQFVSTKSSGRQFANLPSPEKDKINAVY